MGKRVGFRGLATSALLLSLIPAWGCVQVRGSEVLRQTVVVDDFENDFGRWNVSSGDLQISADPEGASGGKVLEWRYPLSKDFIFLTTGARMERFAGADEVAFRIQSDRPGRFFIRLDQTNKAAFATSFTVGTSWREVRLRLKDIKLAGWGFQKLDGSKIKAVYLVDLTGKDEGATGARTVWLDDLRAIGSSLPALRPSGTPGRETADEDVSRVKEGLVLRAFTTDGQAVTMDLLKSYGVSGAAYAFLTNLDHYPRPGVLASSNGRGNGLPVLKAQPDDPVSVNVLFWPIPNFGKLWVEADNAGAGYRLSSSERRLVVNLNLELARSRVAKVEKFYASARQRVAALARLQPRLTALRAMVTKAEAGGDDRTRARLADEALAEGMRLGESVALDIARADIVANRMGRLEVQVASDTNAPVTTADVEITQEGSDFLFGVVQSLGFTERTIPASVYDRVAALAHEAGFNNFTTTLFWDHIEPSQGKYIVDEWDERLGLPAFARAGFSLKGHGLLHSWVPQYVKKAGKRAFAANVLRNFQEVVPRYEKKYPNTIRIWQAANEAGSNRFTDLSIADKIDLLRKISATLHRAAPQAKVWINEVDWDRAQRFWPDADQHLKDLRSPLEFFELLNANQVDFDIAGLQWYPGLRVSYLNVLDLSEPMTDLLRTMEMLDRYQRLKQPLHITEFALPGTSDSEWRNGYRYKNWDQEAQAVFAAEFYTVAFSRPHIHEITYWGLTDQEPWAIKGGLLDDKYKPKPIYKALRDALRAWRSSGSVRTGRDGRVTFQGFAGDYAVSVRSGDRTSQTRARIDERATTRARVVLPR